MGNFCFVPSRSQRTTIIRKSTSDLFPNLRSYTFYELRTATRNFKPDSVIGKGSWGNVYKGWVDGTTLNHIKSGQGITVAVKKCRSHTHSTKRLKEWQAEVNFLGRLSHPNIVKLMGYCLEDRKLLLVYEYMAKGSLENHLFRKGTGPQPLSWNLRLKILIGAARGLAFLHSSDKQVIYRDLKPSHILLDSDYSPKLSDFGIAKNGPTGGDSHVTTRIMGTYGYAAPEYVATGHLSVKSDVYGFGVVLLEMLTGLRVLDSNRPREKQNLIDWAKPYLLNQRKLTDLVMDKSLEGQYNPKAALQAAQLALHCISSNPRKRPSMQEAVDILLNVNSIAMSASNESGDEYKSVL